MKKIALGTLMIPPHCGEIPDHKNLRRIMALGIQIILQQRKEKVKF